MQKKILIVDEDETALLSLENALKNEGFLVRSIPTIKIIYSELKSFLPDLLIMEIRFSNIDGRTLCDELKQAKNIDAVPVILLTSLSFAEIRDIECQADAIFGKPFKIEFIIPTINDLLGIN